MDLSCKKETVKRKRDKKRVERSEFPFSKDLSLFALQISFFSLWVCNCKVCLWHHLERHHWKTHRRKEQICRKLLYANKEDSLEKESDTCLYISFQETRTRILKKRHREIPEKEVNDMYISACNLSLVLFCLPICMKPLTFKPFPLKMCSLE